MSSSVAAVLVLNGFDRLFARSGRRQSAFLQAIAVLLVLRVAVASKREEDHEANERSGRAPARHRAGTRTKTRVCCSRQCFATDTNRLRLSVFASSKFIGEGLADGWAGTVSRKGTDMNEQFSATALRSDKAESPVVMPGSQGSGVLHL